MNIETRVAQLGDLLGQELNTLGRVAEDYRLINLELNNKAGNGPKRSKTALIRI